MAKPGKNLVSEKEIFDYLMTKPGMTEIKAAGIVANIAKESMYYSDAVQMGDVENPGIGLFQYTLKSRKDAFLEAVPDWETNWRGQIDFAFEENEFKSYMEQPYNSVQDSTRGFMKTFEKPKDQSEEEVQDRVDRLYKSKNIQDDLKNLPKVNLEKQIQEGIQSEKEEAEKFGYKLEDWQALNNEQRNQIRKQFNLINPTTSEQTDDEEETIPNVVLPEVTVPENKEIIENETKEEPTTVEQVTDEQQNEKKPSLNLSGQLGNVLKAASNTLDSIGGPSTIISYILGKKGLTDAMKEITPQKRAELSPLFYQHLRQSRELAKKGFHPAEERAIQKEIDNAYRIGLDNAVRGTGGDRAKFLAQSGILDSKRSSALLEVAAKDAELRRQNQDSYADLMMFKENYDQQRSEQERTEDMQMQLANKQAATQFTSQALSNVLSGVSGNSSIMRQIMNNYLSGSPQNNLGLVNQFEKKK
tara:strand:+ start:672 stop:2090 length:1419 start_codon:yes stop_codon:yes gene_type:complete